jgi:hypothetical protein
MRWIDEFGILVLVQSTGDLHRSLIRHFMNILLKVLVGMTPGHDTTFPLYPEEGQVQGGL